MSINELYNIFNTSSGISIDTRSLSQNNLFFALSGPNHNGNTFADAALNKGAIMAIVDDPKYADSDRTILVDDSLKALQELATFHRYHIQGTLIAITGSNGKTTNKELLYNILSKKYDTDYTKGNLNNHIGVPLTLLNCRTSVDYLIVEMGANHQGEIKQLCEIAQPDYGFITNIGKAHLEGFGGIEGVKKGKGELYDYLTQENKHAFVQTYDPVLQQMIRDGMQVIPIDRHDIEILNYTNTISLRYKDIKINSALSGEYNVSNIIHTLRIAEYFRVESTYIKKGIEEYIPSNNRSQIEQVNNTTFYLDAYNANPTSMSLSIANFEQLRINLTEKYMILGDMLELGEYGEEEHRAIVQLCEKTKIPVSLIGPHFHQLKQHYISELIQFYLTVDEFLVDNFLEKVTDKNVLLKGSRGMQLERVYRTFSEQKQ